MGDVLGAEPFRVAVASEDASFRRYFRVSRDEHRWIVMDAPPDREDVRPFMAVARLLESAGVNAPRILAANVELGFLLLTDLGSRLYLDALDDPACAPPLYDAAIDALVAMQAADLKEGWELPPYDRAQLLREMALFSDWLVDHHLELAVPRPMLDAAFDLLADNSLAQPQVFVHRDYHSRNLMVCPDDNPGILDFQDAMRGAVTYDLVSLLRDCYVTWPADQVDGWLRTYRERASAAGVPVGTDETQFRRWFDLMGVQRHLKAAGIFARLWHRDGKPGYLGDVPRTLTYVVEVARDHAELAELGRFVADRVLPALATREPPCAR